MNTDLDVIVIGAGLNGLTTAALLAQAGRTTLVLEQRAFVGGLAAAATPDLSTVSPGILHDTGTVPAGLVDALNLYDHGLRFADQNPSLNILLDEGDRIALCSDRDATANAVDAASGGDGEGYRRYRDLCIQVAPVFQKLFLHPLPQRRQDAVRLLPHALSWWRSPSVHELLRVAPLSAKDFLREFFQSDSLMAALAAPACIAEYGGPYTPFGALHILMRESLSQRYVTGGLTALATALTRAATHYGVTIQTNARVVEVLLTDTGTACGVRLASGETIRAQTVAASCSPRQVFGAFLHPRALGEQFGWHARGLRSRGTTAHLVLQLGHPASQLSPYARLAPGIEALERAFDTMKHGSMPESFSLEIAASPDPTVLSVLAHYVPHTLPRDTWPKVRQELLEKVLAQLRPHLDTRIHASQVLLPQDLEEAYGLPGGHLYHLEQAPDQLLARPFAGYATPVPGLYLCGRGTHPGGSVSCVPGMLATRAILAD